MLYFLSVSKWTMPFQFVACDALPHRAFFFSSLSPESLIYVAFIKTLTESPDGALGKEEFFQLDVWHIVFGLPHGLLEETARDRPYRVKNSL